MKNAYDYLVKNDIISKNMKGVISVKCYALDGREIYNGLNNKAIKKLKGFIDREEIKNKINLLKSIQLKTSTHPKIKWLDKKEILELLK